MIENYYIPCEQYRGVAGVDDMNVKVYNYSKIADITGVIVQSSDRILVNNEWKYKNTPIFITNDVILKYDRILYKGIMYEVDSDPNDVMERNHHYEMSLSVVI